MPLKNIKCFKFTLIEGEYFPFNALSPHDALQHHFKSLKTDLIFLQPRVLRRKIFMKLVYQYMAIFFNFNYIKSSSSTTSRELRQQFAACSG